MRRIGLVACSSKKLKAAKLNPNNKYPACDLYQGNVFKQALNGGLQHFGCKDYFILSDDDQHVLLKPDDMIAWYDAHKYKGKKWAKSVIAALGAELGNLDDYQFVFFACKEYWGNLIDNMEHYITLEFAGRNKITWNILNSR